MMIDHRLAEFKKKKTHPIRHKKMEKWFGREKRWKEKSMDPIGQAYLPGYFCPAALFDSRETTQDKGRVGADTT